MKKNNKTGIIATIIITVALLAALSVITWAIPMPNKGTPAFITAYVCAMVLILAEGILTIVVLFRGEELNKKILGLPILYFGMVAVIMQLVLSTIFFIVNAFVRIPDWIIIVLEVLLILVVIIQVTIGFFFQQRVKEFKNGKEQTSFVNMLRAKIQIVVTNNSNKELERPLQELFETARGTDPVSSPATQEVEQKLTASVDELKEKVESNASNDEVLEAINKVDKLIKERAILCKAAK